MVGVIWNGHPFGDFEVAEAAVNAGEGFTQDGEEGATAVLFAADGDEDFFVFGIGFDAGDVFDGLAFGVVKHDAAAPIWGHVWGLATQFRLHSDRVNRA